MFLSNRISELRDKRMFTRLASVCWQNKEDLKHAWKPEKLVRYARKDILILRCENCNRTERL